MKILVDTNIFLDLILKRNAFESAVLIFNAIEKRLFLGVVLDITILNIDYIAQKQIKDVKEFLKLVNKHFDVVGASNEWIEEALKIDNKDLEDNLHYVGAKKLHCDAIITNDKDFYSHGIITLRSSEFVKRYL